MDSYIIYNSVMLTTSAFAPVALGTALKTHLQLATAANRRIWIDGWGYSLSAPPTGASKIELLQTDVAANTGSALALANDVQKLDPASPTNSSLQSGAALTGFNFSVEGSTTASRLLGHDFLPANPATDRTRFEQWFIPGKLPVLAASSFLRIRTIMGSAVDGLLWIAFTD